MKKRAAEKHRRIVRLKKIEGQVRGLQKMVENDEYCIDVITQTSAVRNALRSFEAEVLKEHMNTCALHQIKNGNEQKAMDEILKVYKLKK